MLEVKKDCLTLKGTDHLDDKFWGPSKHQGMGAIFHTTEQEKKKSGIFLNAQSALNIAFF